MEKHKEVLSVGDVVETTKDFSKKYNNYYKGEIEKIYVESWDGLSVIQYYSSDKEFLNKKYVYKINLGDKFCIVLYKSNIQKVKQKQKMSYEMKQKESYDNLDYEKLMYGFILEESFDIELRIQIVYKYIRIYGNPVKPLVEYGSNEAIIRAFRQAKKVVINGVKKEILVDTKIEHPDYYGGKENIYEAIKVIEAWRLCFCLGNAIKYISRAGKKDDIIQDLEKAKWYLERKIKQLKGENNENS